jgi:hypothetical protein
LCTPPQTNLTPSLIISSNTSFPSWLIAVTFLRSTISGTPPAARRVSFHSFSSSPTPRDTSSPSTTMRHRRSVLTVVIFSMTILLGPDCGPLPKPKGSAGRRLSRLPVRNRSITANLEPIPSSEQRVKREYRLKLPFPLLASSHVCREAMRMPTVIEFQLGENKGNRGKCGGVGVKSFGQRQTECQGELTLSRRS